MNRKWTNRFRFLLDECIPPVIRDSRWFMYPLYYWAYRGKHIAATMDFKKNCFQWDAAQLQAFYSGIHSISSDRKTDLTSRCIDIILNECNSPVESVLDVGCGKGYLLKQLHANNSGLRLMGADLV